MIQPLARWAGLGGYLGVILGAALAVGRVAVRASQTGWGDLEYDVLMVVSLVEMGSLAGAGVLLGGVLGMARVLRRGRAGYLIAPALLVVLLLGARVGLGLMAQASTRANRLPIKPDEPVVVLLSLIAVLSFHLLVSPWVLRRPRPAAALGLVAFLLLAAPGVLAFVDRTRGDDFQAREVAERWGLTVGAAGSFAPKPNVLLVTIDSLRPDYLGAYGNPWIATPHLDELAREGAVFTAATTVQPTTLPAHLSLFSGVYPATHGGRDHIGSLLPNRFDTLSMILKAAGYRTAGFFSYIGLRPEFSNLERGFDVYQDMTQGLPPHMTNPVVGHTSRLLRRVLDESPLAKVTEEAVAATTGLEERLWDRAELNTEAALQWLQGPGDGPSFLWVHYFDPHYPYTPPPRYDTMYDPSYRGSFDGDWPTIRFVHEGGQPGLRDIEHIRAVYAGEVSYTDRELGRVFQHLRDAGRLDTTLVVVLADHGQALGEGREWFHNTGVSQTMNAIPLLLRYPSLIQPTRVAVPVETIDVMPTILQAAGISPGGPLEGKSLLPLLHGQEDGMTPATIIERADRVLVAIRQGEWKLIVNTETDDVTLYNLGLDPEEQIDLAAQRSEVVQQLYRLLEAWWQAHP